MIKVLPLPGKRKIEPFYLLETMLGYGEHLNDTFTTRSLVIVEKKSDSFNEITFKEAEELYKFFNDILNREECYGITLNDAWKLTRKDKPSTFWYDKYMSKSEIKKFAKLYRKYQHLFNPEVEHNWYGLRNINIYYYDENSERHKCEVC